MPFRFRPEARIQPSQVQDLRFNPGFAQALDIMRQNLLRNRLARDRQLGYTPYNPRIPLPPVGVPINRRYRGTLPAPFPWPR